MCIKSAVRATKSQCKNTVCLLRSLEDIQSRLEELNNQYDESLRNKSELNSSAEELRVKLERAESLITGLADERDRWELSLESYKDKLGNIPGDALLGSAFMSYAGPFTSTYRSHLVSSVGCAIVEGLCACNQEKAKHNRRRTKMKSVTLLSCWLSLAG